MTQGHHSRRGRRTAGLLWLSCLLLVSAIGASGARDLDQEETTETIPRAAPRDTTGQAALDWRIQHPERSASVIRSDRTIYRTIFGETVTFYYGNVYVDRDTVVARADSAHVYNDRDLTRLFDHVRLRHNTTRIACDWLEYRRDGGEADLEGHVRVLEGPTLTTSNLGEMREDLQLMRLYEDAVLISPEYNVRADTLVRDRRIEHAEAFGRVRIMDPEAGTLVTGDHALFATDGTWAEVDQNPVLVSRQEGSDPVNSVAGNMKFYRYEERMVMTDSVRIHQGHLRAYADTTISYGKERMLLLGQPHLEQGERSRMYGDEIEFYYRDGALYRVLLVGNARMEDSEPDSIASIFRGLPSMDIIEGDSIAVHFRDGAIHHTDVVGRAHSIYVPVEVENEVAFNDVQGDTMVLRFADDKIREVEVRGNMSGTYHFADLTAMRGPLIEAITDTAAVDSLVALADSLGLIQDIDTAVLDSLVARADSVATVVRDSLNLTDLDSLTVDSLVAASIDTFDFNPHAQDVVYAGHSVLFDLANRTIKVEDDASITYGSMTLTAREIILDTDSRELYADGDPLIVDSETIAGRQMGYDFGNRTGNVRDGVTSFDGYYYVGEEIQRFPDGSLKICSGKMTSCDLDKPHYHFWGNRMKMRMGDKVVAAPIVMRVGNVPVFALPFFFKTLKEGRRSGILFPNFNFGWSEREGRYIRDLGYFWATNDYTDFTFEIDYNERKELAWRVANRYNKRYSFNGSAVYSALKSLDDSSSLESQWQFKWNHNQPNLWDDYNFKADVSMASSELSRNDLGSNTGRDVINGQLKSNVYVSRNWSLINTSVRAERTEYTNARDEDDSTDNTIYTMTLPSLSLGFKSVNLAPELGPGEDGNIFGDIGRVTSFGQSYSMSNVQGESEETRTRTYGGRGSWSLNMRPPRVGIFNLSAGATSGWTWNRTDSEGRFTEDDGSTWTAFDTTTENSKPSLSFRGGISTTLYGVIPARVGPLQALRHTLGLSSGINYRPQLGSKQESSNGYSLSMSNRFDIKYLGHDDADSAVVKKLDGLLDWNLSTSYNPDVLKSWSDISSSVSFKPGRSRNLAFKMSQTIDPYAWHIKATRFNYGYNFQGRFDTGSTRNAEEEVANSSVARLGLADSDSLAAARADSLAQAQGEWDEDDPFLQEDDRYPQQEDAFYGDQARVTGQDGPIMRQDRDETEGGRYIPWTLGGSFSLNKTSSSDVTTRANVNISTQLTRDWQFRYTASFDLEAGVTTRQEYRLQRDLHCWRLEFTRTVSTYGEFGFRFYLMAIPDLKLTRGREGLLGSTSGGVGGLTGY